MKSMKSRRNVFAILIILLVVGAVFYFSNFQKTNTDISSSLIGQNSRQADSLNIDSTRVDGQITLKIPEGKADVSKSNGLSFGSMSP